jgi:hypothetical protein
MVSKRNKGFKTVAHEIKSTAMKWKSCCYEGLVGYTNLRTQSHHTAEPELSQFHKRNVLLTGRDSSVSVVTGLRTGRLRNLCSILGRGMGFFFIMSRPTLRPTQSPIQCVPGATSPVTKWQEREANHSPPLPHFIMGWCLIKPGANISLVCYCLSMDAPKILFKGMKPVLKRQKQPENLLANSCLNRLVAMTLMNKVCMGWVTPCSLEIVRCSRGT